MPIGFWGDDDGSMFRAAYFDRFPGAWAHGDFVRRTPAGGYEIQIGAYATAPEADRALAAARSGGGDLLGRGLARVIPVNRGGELANPV